MALTRGTTCDFPCPICLVPKLEMHKGTVYPIRTTQSMKKVYEDACKMRTAAEAEKHLQGHGLREILVSSTLTWSNAHSNYKTGLIECLLGT